MKKLLYIVTLSLFAVACGNESAKDTQSTDSVNSAPVNDAISNPNHTPGSTTPGEAMGNGDTSSYEGMPNKTSDSTPK
ncbi:MAG: hypothetical protein EOO05_06400 [Chitinophagaceae bacterium]|nr:MAG: hypothetical protein EOO05_06400 [Chitinophagaceae bacterium]